MYCVGDLYFQVQLTDLCEKTTKSNIEFRMRPLRLEDIISSCFLLVNMFLRRRVLHSRRRCMKSVYRLRPTYITRLVVMALVYVVALGLVLPNSLDLSGSRHPLYYLHSNLSLRLQAAKDANTKRVQEVDKYYASLDNSSTIFSNVVGGSSLSDDFFTLAVSIVTVSRNWHKFDSYKPKYLTQTVWKFHSLLRKWNQKKTPDASGYVRLQRGLKPCFVP